MLVPPALAVHQLAKHLERFYQRCPQVTVELHSPGPVDTLDEAYDLTLVTSHIDTTYSAALNGLGTAGKPSYVLEEALMEHALERVLPAWRLFSIALWVAMPNRKHLPARIWAFLDFLIEVFSGEDRDL